jgi:tetratricopeptide (TPR) repeat protein
MSKVFVSSTSRDLRDYRDAAVRACNRLGLVPLDMQFFEAMEAGATAGSLQKLDQADVYLGFFAHRYGFVEPGHDRSVTEHEYDHAGTRGLERLCLVIDPDHSWPVSRIEVAQLGRLNAFKERLGRHIVATFTTVEDFELKAYQALDSWVKRHRPARPQDVPRQLPRAPADFVGRGDILDALQRQIAGGAAISGLRGMGGVGKTTLALKLAERLDGRCPDGEVYLDLKGVDPRPLPWQEAMAHILHAFHPEQRLPATDAELAGRYRSVLAGRPVLLLLDNAAGREQVEPLLVPGGDAVVLVTSRRRFHLPGLAACDLDTLPPADAVTLLRSIAPRVGAEATAIAEQCGYLPLAVRLAGATLAERDDLSPARYLQRLQAARLQALDEVAASIRLSEEQLPEPVRARWCELGVLVGGFEAAWAAAVWGADEATADGYLGTLRRGSLLDWDDETQTYRLHDLVRAYGRDRMDEATRSEAERRHARFFCQMIGDADDLYQKGGAVIAEALRVFDKAWLNAQAGCAWARARLQEDAEAARLCRDYANRSPYVRSLRQHPQDQVAWSETVIQAARQLNDRRGEGQALGNLGLAYAALGQAQRAIESYQHHLAIAREIGDRHGEGTALGNLGLAYHSLGQAQRAIEFYQQHLAIAREVGDCAGEAMASWYLGLMYEQQGDLAPALACLEAGVRFEQEIGHPDAAKDAARVEQLRQRLRDG